MISYRFMSPGDENTISALVERVFMEFVASDYVEEGISEFTKFVTPESLLARSHENYFALVAVHGKEIVGVIEVRDYNHICLLFVEKRFQRMGIAREVLRLAVEHCKKNNPELREIKVNSGPYSVPVYKRLGFLETSPEDIVNGIRFTPMALEL